MLTPEQRVQKIATLRSFPAELRALVGQLSAEQLTTHSIDGEWSIVQNIHHCADSHMNSYIRLKLILTEDSPPLKPYNEAAWAKFRDSNNTDLSHTFSLLDGLHARWVDTFESLTEDQHQRVGHHPEIGDINIDDLLIIYDEHCRAHLDQIRRTLAAQS